MQYCCAGANLLNSNGTETGQFVWSVPSDIDLERCEDCVGKEHFVKGVACMKFLSRSSLLFT